jgi:hypothetical protein
VTVDQQIGALQSNFTGGSAETTAMTISNIATDTATGQLITLDGAFTTSVTSANTGSGAVTVSPGLKSPAVFPTGTAVLRLTCVTYSVTGANGVVPGGSAVYAPYTLLRNTTSTANNALPIVDGIEDLQLAYGVDADADGKIDDQNGDGTVDCKDFIPNDTSTNGQCSGAAGTATMAVGTTGYNNVNKSPTAVRQIRITVVGRAVPPQGANVVNSCWSDKTFAGSSVVQAEDHALAQPTYPTGCGSLTGQSAGIRRRVLSRIITLRNSGTT